MAPELWSYWLKKWINWLQQVHNLVYYILDCNLNLILWLRLWLESFKNKGWIDIQHQLTSRWLATVWYINAYGSHCTFYQGLIECSFRHGRASKFKNHACTQIWNSVFGKGCHMDIFCRIKRTKKSLQPDNFPGLKYTKNVFLVGAAVHPTLFWESLQRSPRPSNWI